MPAERHPVFPTGWRLRLDPENAGLTEGWFERELPADSVPAEVPGIWNTTYPGYAGVAWYEGRFPGRALDSPAARLFCGGSNYLTDIWLNGVHLGRHEGGYDRFSFPCTHAVSDGENRVTLRIVDPPLDGEIDGLNLRTTPTAKESWYGGYGGPWRDVSIEPSAPVRIDSARVHADPTTEQATFRLTIASDATAPTTIDVRAWIDHEQAWAVVRVSPGETDVVLAIPVTRPRLWEPFAAHLYDWFVEIEGPDAVADSAMGRLGFRTAEFRDGVFYLNGQPRFLKGALLQPTYPRTLVRPPLDGERRDIELAQRAGLNVLRCHLRPPGARFLYWCDNQGVMTYVEPPLAWIEPSDRLLEHGKRELAAMVRACANHPSVVMWGIFNENARATEAVGAELMAELAALDPTRPIIENSGGAAVGEVGMWAWGGQSRCWSPGWEAPRPLNDVHIYLANPLRREARTLLATVGDGPMLDVTPGRSGADRIESRLAADSVLVSEYGCGALPDFEAALAAFGDEQHLADAVLLRDLRDDLDSALAARALDREIGDVPTLVEQTQALQAEGILAQTGALRRNPRVSGVILTQLADAGWEQMAGLVGLWRHPRPALAAFKRALQPRLLHLESDDPCTNGAVRVRSWLLEEPGLPPLHEAAVLTMTVESDDAPNRPLMPPASIPVLLPNSALRKSARRGTGTPFPNITLELPSEPGRYRVRARLKAGDWSDEAVCPIRRLPDLPLETGDGLVVLGRGLQAALPQAMTARPDDWTGPILANLPSKPAMRTLAGAIERARIGAHVCLVGLEPCSAAQLGPLLDLPLVMHGARGNFMGMHHYLRAHPIFAGLDAPCLADSGFAEVLPAWAAEELPGAEILAGNFTVPDGGRAFLWRGSVQTLPFGQGHLTIYQLATGARQGSTLGRYLLDRLVGWLLGR